jgi:hypothetical protein
MSINEAAVEAVIVIPGAGFPAIVTRPDTDAEVSLGVGWGWGAWGDWARQPKANMKVRLSNTKPRRVILMSILLLSGEVYPQITQITQIQNQHA